MTLGSTTSADSASNASGVTATVETLPSRLGPLLVGAIVACLVGVASLSALVRIVARGRLHWFAAYCAVVGVATIAWRLSIWQAS